MAGGAGVGRSELTDISLVALQSTATVPLLLAVATGAHHATARLTLRRAGPSPLESFTVALDDVRVTSLHEGASTNETRPTDAFTLAFRKITWTYREQLEDGSAGPPHTGSWDLASGTAG